MRTAEAIKAEALHFHEESLKRFDDHLSKQVIDSPTYTSQLSSSVTILLDNHRCIVCGDPVRKSRGRLCLTRSKVFRLAGARKPGQRPVRRWHYHPEWNRGGRNSRGD